MGAKETGALFPDYVAQLPWCRPLLAQLAAERAALLEQVIGVEERLLVELPVFENWTAKDLLAHVAAWDQVMAERVELVLAGREEEITIYAGDEEAARNEAFYAERQAWSLDQVVESLTVARAGFLAGVSRLPEAEFHRLRCFPDSFEGQTSVREWTEWRARHDALHAADLVAWRETHRPTRGTGPGTILVAALAAAREELLTAAALIPGEERATRPVCGVWTLQDLLGHVADWEWVAVAGLEDMAAGRPLGVDLVTDFDAWNQAHAEARQGQSWERVGSDLHAARRQLVALLETMYEIGLYRRFSFPWGEEGTAYRWVRIFLAHERQHAGDVKSR